MRTMHEAVASVNGQELLEQAREMVGYVEQAFQAGQAAHEVEKALWDRVLELGRHALGMFFRLCGDGDEGERVSLADGQPLRRLEALHARDYQSVFGRFELQRVVYGTREAHEDRICAVGCPAKAPEERVLLPASGLGSVAGGGDAVCSGEYPDGQDAGL